MVNTRVGHVLFQQLVFLYVLQMAVFNVVSNIAFGGRREYDDPVFLTYVNALNLSMKVLGNSSALNLFPMLKYLPGDPFWFHCAQKADKNNRTHQKQYIEFLR